jgi:hypothetical protein
MTTPQQYKEQVIEKFDEQFELESEGCSECGGFELIDKTEVRYPRGTYHCEFDLEKIKDFLLKSIDGAYEKFREEEIERLEGLELSCVDDRLLGKSDEYLAGYNTSTERWRQQRDDQINYLRTHKEK